MKYKGQITDIKQGHLAQSGEDFFDVEFTVLENDEAVHVIKRAFSLETSKEAMVAELKKAIELFASEKELLAAQSLKDAEQDKAKALLEELNGLEV